ncbi:MAG: Bug family tripartite tricarboxylate transporter substrate binding protein [Rhodospirillaceae bacterium]
MQRNLLRLLGVAFAAALLGSGVAHAQNFPSKSIRMILPFPPGGPTDALGRIVAQALSDLVGQPVVADNRPGAGGNLGLELAAKSPPDGYTIVLSSPIISLAPSLYNKLGYDPKDLAPVGMMGGVNNVFVVHPSVPARTLKEFVALARSRPGKLNYGSGGVGTTTHLAPEMLKSMAKINLVHVPYKGSGLAAVALASGEVDMLVATVAAVLPLIQAGKIRPLAVLAPHRLSTLPNVPTSKEAGFDGYEVLVWYGLLTPAATPRDVVTKLNADVNKVLSLPTTKEKLAQLDFQAMPSTPDEFAAFIKSEAARYAKVVSEAGIPKQ